MREVMGTEDARVFVIPLHQEDVSIARQQLITGRLEVSTVTHEHEHLVDELLACESVEIERVPVGQIVECAPQMRQEGDTLIIPVMEEVLVIERRWRVKEEVRVRRLRTTRRCLERVHLRRQEALIARHSCETGTKEGTVPMAAAELKEHDN